MPINPRPFPSPRRIVATLSLAAAAGIAALVFALSAAPALATASCGMIGNATILAHGISCATARLVYRDDHSGHAPHGWVCSAALQRCGKGRVGAKQSVTWFQGGGQGQGQGQ